MEKTGEILPPHKAKLYVRVPGRNIGFFIRAPDSLFVGVKHGFQAKLVWIRIFNEQRHEFVHSGQPPV
jgi:hypothetical protein